MANEATPPLPPPPLPCVCAVVREAREDVAEQLVAPLSRRVHPRAAHRLRVLGDQHELAEALLHHLRAVALKNPSQCRLRLACLFTSKCLAGRAHWASQIFRVVLSALGSLLRASVSGAIFQLILSEDDFSTKAEPPRYASLRRQREQRASFKSTW